MLKDLKLDMMEYTDIIKKEDIKALVQADENYYSFIAEVDLENPSIPLDFKDIKKVFLLCNVHEDTSLISIAPILDNFKKCQDECEVIFDVASVIDVDITRLRYLLCVNYM